ncbi:hypothetical protein FSPOR_2490 [Fusarium sporotrichioides]|uniref:Uncharacterized protein n=1 Tax=Fusarium sporotrichioides TaxID=5514 RepID=A0A395SJW1_FUSSP|nr:hypothetical protein FSPOR_2490 [Fusarium sporotrichioides]
MDKTRDYLQENSTRFAYRIRDVQRIFEDDVDLSLFQIVKDTVKDRQDREGSPRWTTMTEFRICCFWRYVVEYFRIEWERAAFGEPDAPPSEYANAENEDDYTTESYYDDDADYEYQSTNSDDDVERTKSKRKTEDKYSSPNVEQPKLEAKNDIEVEHRPPPSEVRNLLDDWFEDNAAAEDHNDSYDRKQDEIEDTCKGLDFRKILDRMETLDPDGVDVHSILSSDEVQTLQITTNHHKSPQVNHF